MSGWMCETPNCINPVTVLGDKLCYLCGGGPGPVGPTPVAPVIEGEDTHTQDAEEAASAYLEESSGFLAQALERSGHEFLAMASALQGILVCQIELLRSNAAALEANGLMLPEGFTLPDQEPEKGPKAWGL